MVLTIIGTAISVASQTADTVAQVAMPVGHAVAKCAGDLVFFAAYGAAKCLDYITMHVEPVESPWGNFEGFTFHLVAPLMKVVFT